MKDIILCLWCVCDWYRHYRVSVSCYIWETLECTRSVIWHALSYTCVIHDSYTCLTSYLFLVFRTPCCRRSGRIPATGSLSYSSPWSGSLTLGAPPGSRRFDLNPCCRLPLGKSKRKTGWPQGIEIGHRISGWCRVRYQSASLCYWISYILFIAFW